MRTTELATVDVDNNDNNNNDDNINGMNTTTTTTIANAAAIRSSSNTTTCGTTMNTTTGTTCPLHVHRPTTATTTTTVLYEMNVSRDESDIGEEYFLPHRYNDNHQENQNHPYETTSTEPLPAGGIGSTTTASSAMDNVVVVPSTTTTTTTSGGVRGRGEEFTLSRNISNHSLVELLYGEEIVTHTNTTLQPSSSSSSSLLRRHSTTATTNHDTIDTTTTNSSSTSMNHTTTTTPQQHQQRQPPQLHLSTPIIRNHNNNHHNHNNIMKNDNDRYDTYLEETISQPNVVGVISLPQIRTTTMTSQLQFQPQQPQPQPHLYNNNNNNNNTTTIIFDDELGSVSTNTISIDDHQQHFVSGITTPVPRNGLLFLGMCETTTTTTPITPPTDLILPPMSTTTPPSMPYPPSLSPPQLLIQMNDYDHDDNNNNIINRHQCDIDLDTDDIHRTTTMSDTNHYKNDIGPRLQLQHSQNQHYDEPPPTDATAVPVLVNTTINHHAAATAAATTTTSSPARNHNKKYLPPRAPQQQLQQQQYRIIGNAHGVGVPNNNSNNNNHSSSSSNNSSISAMSSVPITPPVVKALHLQSPPPAAAAAAAATSSTTNITNRNKQQPQHGRALSTGDTSSILSALTIDSGEYNEMIMTTTTTGAPAIKTPNNMYTTSSRSYVGLPSFRDSSSHHNNNTNNNNNNTSNQFRRGTRSLSGRSTMNQQSSLDHQHRNQPLEDLRHSSTPSLGQSNNNNKNYEAIMSGMNVDVPSCLQQPILGDDEDGDEHKNDQNMFHNPPANASNISTTQTRFDTIPPVIASSKENNDNIHDDDMLSSEMSPLIFHSLDPNHTPDRLFLDAHQANEEGRGGGGSFHYMHRKLPKLSEYETEAETAILAAIEEETKRGSIVKNVNAAIFPNLSFNSEIYARSELEDEEDEQTGKLDTTKDNLSTAFSKWYALQNAEIGSNEGLVQHKRKSQGFSVTAMNSLADNATSLLDKVHHKNSKRISTSVRKTKASVVERNETLPTTTSDNTEIHIRRVDDIAIEEAENGERRDPDVNPFVNRVKQLQHRTVEGVQKIMEQRKADWIAFEACILPQKETALGYLKDLMTFCIAPSLLLACILFYGYNNPPTGRFVPSFPLVNESMSDQPMFSDENFVENSDDTRSKEASISWWVIFLGVRHPLVWSLARASEYILSNFLGTSSPHFMKLVGPRMGLIITHSKGWPCILIMYGVFCLQLLQGESSFVKHWFFWQSIISLFTEANPAGDITGRDAYVRFLIMIIFIGFSVSIKRVWLGYYFGRRICARYSDDLHELLEKLLLLSEIATLSFTPNRISTEMNVSSDVGSLQSADQNHRKSQATIDDYDESPRRNFLNLLEEWDEPRQLGTSETHVSSLKEILEFRQTVNLMQTEHPFSRLFGRADSRDACVVSSAKVYNRLVKNQNGNTNLQFSTLAAIALTDGEESHKKMRRLINLFRPNKDKELTLLDFTRSVDSVYRELRTLSAGINNSTAIDRVFELIINAGFYALLFVVCLAVLDVGVTSFVVAFSSSILALSFIISSASSSLFEGIMMILVRRPYDVGDRIALSNVEDDTDPTGSFGWIVEDIDIFYTTVRFGATREVATVSNGSIVRCRIINARRSDDAQLMIRMKFGIDTSKQQIQLFQRALEKFIEDRPQEYHNTLGFRLATVAADLGYIEYMIVVQCRSSWQKIGSVLDSRARVNSFCLELQKQLNMRYVAPPMPINLNLNEGGTSNNNTTTGRNNGGTTSSILPERRESDGILHRTGSRRDSDLVFSMKSGQGNKSTSIDVENIVAQLRTESKKEL